MQQLPPQPASPLEKFTHLLSAGVLGVISFVLVTIILLPVIIITIPYMLYIRWKIKRQMRDMMAQMQEAMGGMGGMDQGDGSSVEDAPPTGAVGRKHVDVTVKTVGFEDSPADGEKA